MLKLLVAVASLFLTPGFAQACVVCFSGGSADMARGFYWGVVLLLALPFVLLASIIGLIAFHIRKNKPAIIHQ